MRGFLVILTGVGAALTVAAYLWRGVDFAEGVLLGCALVGLNLYWMARSVSAAMQAQAPRVRVAVSYALRFGLSVLVLYAAIVELGMHPMGIVVGVTSLLIASVAYALRPGRRH